MELSFRLTEVKINLKRLNIISHKCLKWYFFTFFHACLWKEQMKLETCYHKFGNQPLVYQLENSNGCFENYTLLLWTNKFQNFHYQFDGSHSQNILEKLENFKIEYFSIISFDWYVLLAPSKYAFAPINTTWLELTAVAEA